MYSFKTQETHFPNGHWQPSSSQPWVRMMLWMVEQRDTYRHPGLWGPCGETAFWYLPPYNYLTVAGRGTPSGPESGLLSNTWKWLVWGDTSADKARDFIGKGRLGGEQQGKGTQESSSVTWLAVSGFMVMGLVSGLSLANHLTQSPSCWCTPCSAKMNAREDSGRWSDTWCLLLNFPELFQLMVAY